VSLGVDLGFTSNFVVCDGGGVVSIQRSCNSYSD